MTGTKPRAKTPRVGWGRGECKRSGHRCLAVVLFLLLAITPAGAETRKVRVNDPATAQDLLAHGGKLIADYGGFQVIETGQASGRLRPAGADPDVIELNARRISTRSTAWRAHHDPSAGFPEENFTWCNSPAPSSRNGGRR